MNIVISDIKIKKSRRVIPTNLDSKMQSKKVKQKIKLLIYDVEYK